MHHGTSKPIADALIALRSRIEKGGIPSSKLDETLNLATWNIREWCAGCANAAKAESEALLASLVRPVTGLAESGFGKKARSEAAIHYIAEILGQFDLIGIVELRDNFARSEIGRPQAGAPSIRKGRVPGRGRAVAQALSEATAK